MNHPIAGKTTVDDNDAALQRRPPRALEIALVRGNGEDATNDAARDVRNGDARVSPLVLPAVSPAAARATRTAVDARLGGFALARFGVEGLDARVVDATETETDAFDDPAIVEIALAAAGGEPVGSNLRIALDLRAYPSLAIAAWPARDAPITHEALVPHAAELALRRAVAGVMLEPLLARLSQVLQCGARLVEIRRARLAAAVQIALSFASNGKRHDVRIAADARCLDRFDGLLNAPTDDNPAMCQSLPLSVPGSLIIGVKRLAIDTLRSLEAGDVLLRAVFASWNATLLTPALAPALAPVFVPAEGSAAPRPRAIAAWGTPGLMRLSAVVELDGHTPVIVKEPNMSEELDPASADAGLAVEQPDNPIQIGELELPVQFEIDTVALPLAQLSSLGPGYVVELPVPVTDARLRLVAHGQTIGYGELVAVGEHLGIRIIRMAHRHGPVQ